MSLSKKECMTWSPDMMDGLKLRDSLLELVEELRITRITTTENERRIEQLVADCHEHERKLEEEVSVSQGLRDGQAQAVAEAKNASADKIRELEVERNKIQLSSETWEREMKAMKEEVRNLQLCKYNLEKLVREQAHRLHTQTQTKTSYAQQVAEVQARTRDIGRQMASYGDMLGNLRKEVTEARRVNNMLVFTSRHQKCQLSSLKSEIETKQSEILKLRVAARKSPDETRRDNREAKIRADEQEKTLVQISASNEDLKKELNDVKRAHELTKAQLLDGQAISQRCLASSTALLERTKRKELEVSELTAQCMSLSDQQTHNEKTIVKLQHRIEQLQKQSDVERSRLEAELAVLRAECSSAQKARHTLEQINARWADKNSALTVNLQSLQDELDGKPNTQGKVCNQSMKPENNQETETLESLFQQKITTQSAVEQPETTSDDQDRPESGSADGIVKKVTSIQTKVDMYAGGDCKEEINDDGKQIPEVGCARRLSNTSKDLSKSTFLTSLETISGSCLQSTDEIIGANPIITDGNVVTLIPFVGDPVREEGKIDTSTSGGLVRPGRSGLDEAISRNVLKQGAHDVGVSSEASQSAPVPCHLGIEGQGDGARVVLQGTKTCSSEEHSMHGGRGSHILAESMATRSTVSDPVKEDSLDPISVQSGPSNPSIQSATRDSEEPIVRCMNMDSEMETESKTERRAFRDEDKVIPSTPIGDVIPSSLAEENECSGSAVVGSLQGMPLDGAEGKQEQKGSLTDEGIGTVVTCKMLEIDEQVDRRGTGGSRHPAVGLQTQSPWSRLLGEKPDVDEHKQTSTAEKRASDVFIPNVLKSQSEVQVSHAEEGPTCSINVDQSDEVEVVKESPKSKDQDTDGYRQMSESCFGEAAKDVACKQESISEASTELTNNGTKYIADKMKSTSDTSHLSRLQQHKVVGVKDTLNQHHQGSLWTSPQVYVPTIFTGVSLKAETSQIDHLAQEMDYTTFPNSEPLVSERMDLKHHRRPGNVPGVAAAASFLRDHMIVDRRNSSPAGRPLLSTNRKQEGAATEGVPRLPLVFPRLQASAQELRDSMRDISPLDSKTSPAVPSQKQDGVSSRPLLSTAVSPPSGALSSLGPRRAILSPLQISGVRDLGSNRVLSRDDQRSKQPIPPQGSDSQSVLPKAARQLPPQTPPPPPLPTKRPHPPSPLGPLGGGSVDDGDASLFSDDDGDDDADDPKAGLASQIERIQTFLRRDRLKRVKPEKD